VRPVRRAPSDRLGPIYSQDAISAAIASRAELLGSAMDVDVARVAADIHAGKVVARFHGRSEFGPRALGARSLLASPLRPEIKDRLNKIKGRQSWRPVAPIVQADRVSEFFDGPETSPNMTFRHLIKPRFRDRLVALHHPDGSSRAQTIIPQDDPELYELLSQLDARSGFPIAVNTSLNGVGEPIVESPQDALSFFLLHADVDYLILGSQYVSRPHRPCATSFALAVGSMVTVVRVNEELRFLLSRGEASLEISREVFDRIGASGPARLDQAVEQELRSAQSLGLLLGRPE
jgi:carbamoyltransferase